MFFTFFYFKITYFNIFILLMNSSSRNYMQLKEANSYDM